MYEGFRLDGKVVAVTGAAQGVGRELALAFASEHARVVALDLNGTALESLAAEVEGRGGELRPYALDIKNVSAVRSAFDETVARWGSLDVVCNNAGVNVHKDSLNLDEAEWDFVMDVNLKALFFCCQSAGRAMQAVGKGKIINTASTFGVVGFPQRAAYCASKGGVVQLTRALAVEWAPLGINVNAVAPAAIDTPSRSELFSNPEFMKGLLSRLPLGRLAQISDVVGATLFLAGPASDFITGHVLVVDGGWTAQ